MTALTILLIDLYTRGLPPAATIQEFIKYTLPTKKTSILLEDRKVLQTRNQGEHLALYF